MMEGSRLKISSLGGTGVVMCTNGAMSVSNIDISTLSSDLTSLASTTSSLSSQVTALSSTASSLSSRLNTLTETLDAEMVTQSRTITSNASNVFSTIYQVSTANATSPVIVTLPGITSTMQKITLVDIGGNLANVPVFVYAGGGANRIMNQLALELRQSYGSFTLVSDTVRQNWLVTSAPNTLSLLNKMASAPRNVTVSSTLKEVKITFDEPLVAFSPISSYQVYASLNGTETPVEVATVNAPFSRPFGISLTNLRSGASYTFQVAASTSSSGGDVDGELSAPTGLVKVVMVASEPRNVVVTSTTSEVSVAFDAPLVALSTVVGYKVYASLDGTQDAVEVASLSSPFSSLLHVMLTSLSCGSSYTFQVAAVTADGEGVRSSLTSLAKVILVATAPRNLVVTSTTSNVKITFEAPLVALSTVVEYKVYASLNGTQDNVEVTTLSLPFPESLSVSMTSMTTLLSGASYTFQMSAVTADGEGEWSAPTSLVKVIIPALVTNLNVTSTTSGVTLTFDAPLFVSSPILTYKVYASFNGTETPIEVSTMSSPFPEPLSVSLTNLVSGASYTFQVSAVTTDDGEGELCPPTALVEVIIPGIVVDLGMSTVSYSGENPAPVGAVWKNSLAPLPTTTLVGGATTFPTGKYFVMDGSNYWKASNLRDFSWGNGTGVRSSTISVWVQPRTPSTVALYSASVILQKMIVIQTRNINNYYVDVPWGYNISVTTSPFDKTVCMFSFISYSNTPSTVSGDSSTRWMFNNYDPVTQTGTPTWYKITLVASHIGSGATTLRMYVNENPVAGRVNVDTLGYEDQKTASEMTIGGIEVEGSWKTKFRGFMSTTQFYNYALTEQQIADSFEQEKTDYGYSTTTNVSTAPRNVSVASGGLITFDAPLYASATISSYKLYATTESYGNGSIVGTLSLPFPETLSIQFTPQMALKKYYFQVSAVTINNEEGELSFPMQLGFQ